MRLFRLLMLALSPQHHSEQTQAIYGETVILLKHLFRVSCTLLEHSLPPICIVPPTTQTSQRCEGGLLCSLMRIRKINCIEGLLEHAVVTTHKSLYSHTRRSETSLSTAVMLVRP